MRWVLDRLPPSFRRRVAHVIVADDASDDATYDVGIAYQSTSDLPMTVYRQPVNLGYGGNQKWGYRWAIEHELDVVVLLHGDGQYAPEVIEDLVTPLEAGICDAVLGSRMMTRGAARAGGMPMYKYIGNRILSRFQNTMAGTSLSEWHSGYRAYRVDAIRDVAFEQSSDGFDFDTEIILQLHEAGKLIHEVPIPTYYGDEICRVNGMAYAWQVARAVTRYRLHKLGFGESATEEIHLQSYVRTAPESLYGQLQRMIAARPAGRALVVGCGDGQFAGMLRTLGWYVVGTDETKHDNVGEHLDEFVELSYDEHLSTHISGEFDAIVIADSLDQFRSPEPLLRSLRESLAPGGACFVGTPNFAHWYPRLRTAVGRFGYDRRGVLDRRHVRFFTRRSFVRLASSAGWRVGSCSAAGIRVEQMHWGENLASSRAVRALAWADRAGRRRSSNLFALQFVFELAPDAPSTR